MQGSARGRGPRPGTPVGGSIDVPTGAQDYRPAYFGGSLPYMSPEQLEAFNPLHEGHRQMATIACKRLSEPLTYEISIENVDKPTLNWDNLLKRKDKVVSTHTKGLDFLMRKNKITVVRGHARLTGPATGGVFTVQITDEDKGKPRDLQAEGFTQQTKTEVMYAYLIGPRFRHRIEAIVEKFTDMQADLNRERATMTRLWAKREEQLRGVLESTAGLYGDLEGIAGRAMQEIESLDVLMIEAKGEAAE